MIQNPFLPSPASASAWAEGFTKGFAGSSSPEPSADVADEAVDAFNLGVQSGEQAANDGLVLWASSCIPASEEHGFLHEPSVAINGVEIVHGLWEARHLTTLAGGVAGILVALIELACTLPVHTLPPEEVMPTVGQTMIDALTAYGIDSMELFCGAGLDATARDCEIRISPLFKSADAARQAAENMERPAWTVVSWRTDQSNSFRLVDSN